MFQRKPSALRPPERMQMRTATERLSDIMRVSPHIESLRAHDAEFDLRQANTLHFVSKHVNEARLAFHGFSLPREFVQRNAFLFDGTHHWRRLIEVAFELRKHSVDLLPCKCRNLTCLLA